MLETGTGSPVSIQKARLEVEGCVFVIHVRKAKRLDGTRARAYSWEATCRKPEPLILGCGTATSSEDAKESINASIAKYLAAPRAKYARKRLTRSPHAHTGPWF